MKSFTVCYADGLMSTTVQHWVCVGAVIGVHRRGVSCSIGENIWPCVVVCGWFGDEIRQQCVCVHARVVGCAVRSWWDILPCVV